MGELLNCSLTNYWKLLNWRGSARIDAEIWTQYQVGVIHAAGHQQRWCSYLSIAMSTDYSLKHVPV